MKESSLPSASSPTPLMGTFQDAHLESIISDGPENVTEENLGGERVAVVDNGLQVGPVPAIKFQAATTFAECPVGRDR